MERQTQEILSRSSQHTIEIGEKLASVIRPGDVIALIGNLAAGKTHLIKGISSGLGAVEHHEVSSPTFVLINEYDTRDGLCIYHLDAYRLDSVRQLDQLGFDDYCRPDSVVLVEWADKVLPALTGFDYKTIYIDHVSEAERKISMAGFDTLEI